MVQIFYVSLHRPAFRKAFDLLRLGQTEDPAGKDCGSLVVFITGGKFDDADLRCTPGGFTSILFTSFIIYSQCHCISVNACITDCNC